MKKLWIVLGLFFCLFLFDCQTENLSEKEKAFVQDLVSHVSKKKEGGLIYKEYKDWGKDKQEVLTRYMTLFYVEVVRPINRLNDNETIGVANEYSTIKGTVEEKNIVENYAKGIFLSLSKDTLNFSKDNDIRKMIVKAYLAKKLLSGACSISFYGGGTASMTCY